MKNDYSDIINLPHHVSEKHKPMDRINRAAQFAPFAALTGYEECISEEARLTNDEIILDEYEQEQINRELTELFESGKTVKITYFCPDGKKAGGKYVEYVGKIKRIEEIEREIVFEDKKRINVDLITDICEYKK